MKINNNNKIKSLFLLSLVGSGLGNQESQSQSEIPHLNSLPRMATNLTERQSNSNQTLVFAGYPISLSVPLEDNNGFRRLYTKQGTAGFMIVNEDKSSSSWCTAGRNDGFITSVSCFPYEYGFTNALSFEVYDWERLKLLGIIIEFYDTGDPFRDTVDFVYIGNTKDGGSDPIPEIKLAPYVVGGSDDESNFQLYPVTGLGSVTLGSEVCAYGAVSGYNCGNITEVNIDLAIPDPWKVSSGTVNFRNFKSLNKVDLGVNGFYAEEDLGGPVYTLSNIGNRTLAQALGHITSFDNSDPNHKFLYYTPLDKVFAQFLGFRNCSYSLLTYNETNAQEYQELLAQVEIPPKK